MRVIASAGGERLMCGVVCLAERVSGSPVVVCVSVQRCTPPFVRYRTAKEHERRQRTHGRAQGWKRLTIMISCCIAVRMLRRGPVHEERRSATRAARGEGRGRRTKVLGLVVRNWKRVKHKGERERQLWCECESGNSLVRWAKAHSRSCHRSGRRRARRSCRSVHERGARELRAGRRAGGRERASCTQ